MNIEGSLVVPINASSRIVMFSDHHRGVNDWSDDFAHNSLLFSHALNYYYERGYTYIELGDGDELWENRSIRDIQSAHSNTFWMLSRFLADNRLRLLCGNHNWDFGAYVHDLRTVLDREGTPTDLFASIKVHSDLVLQYHNKSILLIHGHQVDTWNHYFWPLGRLFVRYFWKPLQLLGVRDPTSPATSAYRRNKVEEKLVEWVETSGHTLICGHTHRPRFGYPHPRYFNTGSCVHPRCITGIEIVDGWVSLIKWAKEVNGEGRVVVRRSLLALPKELREVCNG